MNRNLIYLAIICFITSCSSNNTDPSEETNCEDLAACEGNTRVYCQNGVMTTEECSAGMTCLNGGCVPNGRCGDDFINYCQENHAVSCQGNNLYYEDCKNGCKDGKCITSNCNEESGYPYCDEAGRRVFCQDGEAISESCDSDKVCIAGECKIVQETCGNGTLDDDEVCDEGDKNGEYGKCRADCSGVSRCGDGIVDTPIEACDDGLNNGKYGKCNDDCSALRRCGDGITDQPDEACDDAEENGNYNKCRADCSGVSRCGDGIVDTPDEVCDDGSYNGYAGMCAADCQSRPGCGNGVLDPGESCDPPSHGLVVTCKADCTKPKILFEEFPTAENIYNDVPESCDPNDLWQKYLIYRERFIGNAAKHIPGFISWGTEPGQSLPAGYRDPETNCASVWRYHHDGCDCAFTDLPDAQGAYDWSDTSLWLGIMAHWLALEYYTYKQNGLDTTETEKFIYLTLKAFDRLDLAAEPYFDVESKLNAFFIRDDIPREFYKSGNTYRFERTDQYSGYECAVSTNTCKIHSGVSSEALLKDGAFVSQDQLTGIYEGFGMIARFVDDDVRYNDLALRHGARLAIDRIIQSLRDNQWRLGLETSNGWLQVPEEWGGYTQLLSSLFAEGANSICAPDFGLESYHDTITDAFKGTIPSVIAMLWPRWETKNNYNRNLMLRLMNYTQFWDDDKFNQISLESGREFWALSHALYWQRPLKNEYPLWRMHSILASAPCEGACSGDSCQTPTPGWMGEHYFVSPNQRVGYAHSEGEYNGLDYLISFNLYYMAYAQKTGRGYTQIIPSNESSEHILEDIIKGSKTPSNYIISNNSKDMSMLFCGRQFSDWVRDNALGLVDIYTGSSRWQCTLDGKCTISSDASPYTHRNAVIIGTDLDDTIKVPQGYHHCIAGLGGNDTITAAAGMHIIEGGSGNDIITTNGPHVTIYGGDGDDSIYPREGYHLIDAGAGNDLIDSANSSGTHLIAGGEGHDTIRAGEGGNTLVGGSGNDILEAGNGNNVVWGNDGNDKIKLGNGDNIIYPGDGSAFILVGNGNNSITTFSPQDDLVHICFGEGKNSVYAGWSSTSFCSAVQNSDIHENSCRPTLDAADCALSAYSAWTP